MFDETEYVPIEDVLRFLSQSIPTVRFIRMDKPVMADDSLKYVFHSRSKIIGYRGDLEQDVANRCLNFITDEVNSHFYKIIGIVGIFQYPDLMQLPEEVETINDHRGRIVLSWSPPLETGTEKDEVQEPYTSKFIKKMPNFDYTPGDVFKSMKEKGDL